MATDGTARQLTNLLMSGAIRPGQFLTIREVSDMLGAPVGNSREAIQQLAQAGFLSVYPNRGIQVTEITPRHIRNAFAFREIIEAHAVRSFIATASDAEIDSLIAAQEAARSRLQRMDEKAQLHLMIEVNEAIHGAFVRSLDNIFVTKYFEMTLNHINWMRANTKISEARHVQVIDEHLQILAAIRDRNIEQAVALTSDHLNKALHLTLYS